MPASRLSRPRGTRQTARALERAYRFLLVIVAMSYRPLRFPVKHTQRKFRFPEVVGAFSAFRTTQQQQQSSRLHGRPIWVVRPRIYYILSRRSLGAHIMWLNELSAPTAHRQQPFLAYSSLGNEAWTLYGIQYTNKIGFQNSFEKRFRG